jgi:hypothetical protein
MKRCELCGCTYHPDSDEFEETQICQDCFELEEQGPDFSYEEHSDADPGL